MSRTAILATMVTSILAYASPSIAASDEDLLSRLGNKMSAAFGCATYAWMSNNPKEHKRLFQIGLKAGRDYVEGKKSSNRLGEFEQFMGEMGELSPDFLIGMIYANESDKADAGIRKFQDGIPRERWLNPSEAQTEAERSYRNSNCSLIQ